MLLRTNLYILAVISSIGKSVVTRFVILLLYFFHFFYWGAVFQIYCLKLVHVLFLIHKLLPPMWYCFSNFLLEFFHVLFLNESSLFSWSNWTDFFGLVIFDLDIVDDSICGYLFGMTPALKFQVTERKNWTIRKFLRLCCLLFVVYLWNQMINCLTQSEKNDWELTLLLITFIILFALFNCLQWITHLSFMDLNGSRTFVA